MTGKDIPVDGPQRNGNVFVAVTISSQYPAEHRLAVTHEVEVDISKDGGKETTVEFLDPSELLGSITERHEPEEGEEEEAEEVTALLPATEEIEEEKIEEEELEEEDLVEQGQDDEEEEQWGDESDEVEEAEEAEEAEKHIYVANVESGYDVSEQLQAMNEVELAISEGFIEQNSLLHGISAFRFAHILTIQSFFIKNTKVFTCSATIYQYFMF